LLVENKKVCYRHAMDQAAALFAPDIKRPRGRPRKTVGERDDGNRRQELVRVAAELFRRKGFDATSTRDVAAAVGMRSGSPFYHFKSKGELLFAVMDEGMQQAIAQQAAVLATVLAHVQQSNLPARAVLRALVRNHFDTLLSAGNDFIPVMLYESRAITLPQRAHLAGLQSVYEAAWEPVLQTLHDAGHIRVDVKLTRLLIFGALNWSVKWFDARKGASLDELTDAALALFLRGDE
jgi:TetR/AcrR family transcriptional regulator, cholesterol catabolism regulator